MKIQLSSSPLGYRVSVLLELVCLSDRMESTEALLNKVSQSCFSWYASRIISRPLYPHGAKISQSCFSWYASQTQFKDHYNGTVKVSQSCVSWYASRIPVTKDVRTGQEVSVLL